MVKITDKTDYSRFASPTSEDEGIWGRMRWTVEDESFEAGEGSVLPPVLPSRGRL